MASILCTSSSNPNLGTTRAPDWLSRPEVHKYIRRGVHTTLVFQKVFLAEYPFYVMICGFRTETLIVISEIL